MCLCVCVCVFVFGYYVSFHFLRLCENIALAKKLVCVLYVILRLKRLTSCIHLITLLKIPLH